MLVQLRLADDAAVPGLPPPGAGVEAVRDGRQLLVSGDAARLRRLLVALVAADAAGLPEDEDPPGAAGSPDPVFTAETPAGVAFDAVVVAGLSHLLTNRGAARAGVMEGVHQVRVAVRRLRSALVLFEPVLEPLAAHRFEAELKRFGSLFGAARDWDVFCEETLPGGLPDVADWRELLLTAAEPRRRDAHAGLAEALDGRAFAALVAGLLAWAGEAAVAADTGSVASHAPVMLDRLATEVHRRGRHVRDGSDAQLHRLRKAFKKLRYGAEFLQPAFPAATADPFLAGCRKLQAVLGRFNDASAGAGLAVQLAGNGRTELLPGVSLLHRRLRREEVDARTRLHAAWRAFARQEPFWR